MKNIIFIKNFYKVFIDSILLSYELTDEGLKLSTTEVLTDEAYESCYNLPENRPIIKHQA